MKEREDIHVVGFPKSGNTWLTRLLADVLECTAGTGMAGRDDGEIASDLNDYFLDKNKHQKFKILKTHYLPKRQLEYSKNLKRIVYIKRDFKDVLISAFFHQFAVADSDVRLVNFFQLIKRRPKKIILYIGNRYKLWKLIEKLTDKWSDDVGSWLEHFNEWQKYSRDNPEKSIVFTTYEDMTRDTSGEIVAILKNLKLPAYDFKKIEASIKRQSFKNKKKYFKNLSCDDKIVSGKFFNIRFLRKGEVGDWKNYLSKAMIRKINVNNKLSYE